MAIKGRTARYQLIRDMKNKRRTKAGVEGIKKKYPELAKEYKKWAGTKDKYEKKVLKDNAARLEKKRKEKNKGNLLKRVLAKANKKDKK